MKLLSAKETAERLGVSYWTLVDWRRPDRPHPLPWVKVGACVRYREEDVARFIERNTVHGSAVA